MINRFVFASLNKFNCFLDYSLQAVSFKTNFLEKKQAKACVPLNSFLSKPTKVGNLNQLFLQIKSFLF